MSPQVIYESEDFVVINKPAGMAVHPARQPQGVTLVDWLLARYPEMTKVGDDLRTRPGIVHRLDKDTSGVILVCRTQEAFAYFKKQFQEQRIKKTYLALVHNFLKSKSGLINKPLGLKKGTIKRTVHGRGTKMIKEAITRYKVKGLIRANKSPFSLLEIEPLTGRTHQIRVHLASIGHPVVGDRLYGKGSRKLKISNQEKTPPRLFLHAESLEFTTPSGQRLKVAADLPADLGNFLKNK